MTKHRIAVLLTITFTLAGFEAQAGLVTDGSF
jgi:hypothetical protein